MRVFTAIPMADWRLAGPAARAAEDVGFDAVMTVELGHDVFTPLALAALATERVELTPSIAVAFPRSPTVMASSAWDLHANSAGRFVLGLGSQVKGHNERRFGIEWTPPAPRLRDYIGALRAVWRSWETGEKLDYHSAGYTLTLMTPAFSPEPTGLPMIPITIAAVGEAMLRVAGQVADGVRLHPLCSRRYLEEVCLPCIAEGMARGGATGSGPTTPGRTRERFDVHGGGFVVTGPDDAAVARASARVRERIAFYGSTRTYLPILALHGLEELGLKLHAMSVRGRWQDMAGEISDEVLHVFAACATYDGLATAIAERFGGAADSIDLNFPPDAPPGLQRELLADIHRIPHRFIGFDTNWASA
jgi:probable F420-dependent oxidoreductase